METELVGPGGAGCGGRPQGCKNIFHGKYPTSPLNLLLFLRDFGMLLWKHCGGY